MACCAWSTLSRKREPFAVFLIYCGLMLAYLKITVKNIFIYVLLVIWDGPSDKWIDRGPLGFTGYFVNMGVPLHVVELITFDIPNMKS